MLYPELYMLPNAGIPQPSILVIIALDENNHLAQGQPPFQGSSQPRTDQHEGPF